MEGSKIWASRPLMVGDSSLMPRSPSYQDWTRLRSQMEGPEVIRPSPENQLFHVMSPSDLAIIDVIRTIPTLAEVNDFTGTAYSTISLSDKLIQSIFRKEISRCYNIFCPSRRYSIKWQVKMVFLLMREPWSKDVEVRYLFIARVVGTIVYLWCQVLNSNLIYVGVLMPVFLLPSLIADHHKLLRTSVMNTL